MQMATLVSLNRPRNPVASGIFCSAANPNFRIPRTARPLVPNTRLCCCKFDQNPSKDFSDDAGVKVALSILRFYKSEVSPLLPRSCRYVPTCSEYSMIAYNKYGFVKGTVLTACRICRCNPLGGSGFDPPRWFGEEENLPED